MKKQRHLRRNCYTNGRLLRAAKLSVGWSDYLYDNSLLKRPLTLAGCESTCF